MELAGDPDGLQALKEIQKDNKEYLKFLITEAKTNLARFASFKGADGRKWKLMYDAMKDQLKVEPDS